MQERIERDFPNKWIWVRYTHYPSGDTIKCSGSMSKEQWVKVRDEWLKKYALMLWEKLGDVPITHDGEIEQEFLFWNQYTPREMIWRWFEEAFDMMIDGKMQLQEMPHD